MKTAEAILKYIEHRRSVGEKFSSESRILQLFSAFVGHGKDLSIINNQQCIAFLYNRPSYKNGLTAYWFNLYGTLEGLFNWATSRNITPFNPLPVDKPKRPQGFIPYIYNREELKRIFDRSMTFRTYYTTFYPEAVRGIILLTYLLGLRPGETLGIEMSDVHLGADNYIVIKQTKFYKTRIVTFNDKVASFLKDYLIWRKREGLPTERESPLFARRTFNRYSSGAIQRSFARIREDAGVRRYDGARYQPRLQDLHHTFATEKVVSWYKEGKDVQDMLPVLSTYLGHTSINSTAVYVSMTNELLKEASHRFESYLF